MGGCKGGGEEEGEKKREGEGEGRHCRMIGVLIGSMEEEEVVARSL